MIHYSHRGKKVRSDIKAWPVWQSHIKWESRSVAWMYNNSSPTYNNLVLASSVDFPGYVNGSAPPLGHGQLALCLGLEVPYRMWILWVRFDFRDCERPVFVVF